VPIRKLLYIYSALNPSKFEVETILTNLQWLYNTIAFVRAFVNEKNYEEIGNSTVKTLIIFVGPPLWSSGQSF
jgi:hypothetical protein